MNILGFGDNVVDRFVDRGIDYPGGNCVNVAVYARRLGLDAAYLGVFGDDDLGAFLRTAVAAQGVAVEHSVVRHGESGVSTLHVRDGDRVFPGYNGGGVTVREPLVLDGDLLAYAASFSLVHSSVYSRRERTAQALRGRPAGQLRPLRRRGVPRPRLPRPCLPPPRPALLSCSELDEAATQRLLQAVVARGARMVLATRGLAGATVYDGRTLVTAPALAADARSMADTMGCGDAFLAGFAVSLLRDGWSRGNPPSRPCLERALEHGTQSAHDQCFVEAAFGHGRPSAPPAPAAPQTQGVRAPLDR
jgi:fructoselysine 6-kinase